MSDNTNSATMVLNSATGSASNLTHTAFEMVKFVDKLPMKIECIACYDNILLVASDTGRILVYEVHVNSHKLESSFERSLSVTKKPVQQMEVCKEFNVLVVMFDAQIHVFNLAKYELEYSIPKTKNCSLFALSMSKDKKLLRMCVACKRRLQFYYLSKSSTAAAGKFMELISDLELTDTPRTLEFTNENLIVFSLRKEFFYYRVPTTSQSVNSSSSSYKQPESKFSNGTRLIEPICEKLHNDCFIIGMDENKTVLYDADGKPDLEYPINWTHSPSQVTCVGFYLIGILPNLNCVEVVAFKPKPSCSVQLIEIPKDSKEIATTTSSSSQSMASSLPSSSITSKIAPILDNVSNIKHGLSNLGGQTSTSVNVSSSERLKILRSNGKSVCYVGNQHNLWCLLPNNINDQLELVLRFKNYELGLNLMECQLLFNGDKKNQPYFEQESVVNVNVESQLRPFFSLKWLRSDIDESLERKLRNMHALDLFLKKKFKQSLELFQKMKTDPTHLVAFLPGLLPNSFRTQLNFDAYYPTLDAKEQEEATYALIDYLNYKRKELGVETNTKKDNTNDTNGASLSLEPLMEGRSVMNNRELILQIIDTTLLKCYLKSKENLVGVFVRLTPNYIHLKESENLLKQHNKLNELITLYERRELHEKALNLLMEESSKSNSNLYGLKHMVEYLKKLDNRNLPLIFKFSKHVIERDVTLAMKIFFAGDYTQIDKLLIAKSIETNESLNKSVHAPSDSKSKNLSLSSLLFSSVNSKNRKNTISNAKTSKDFSIDHPWNSIDMSDFDDDTAKSLNHTEVMKFFQESIQPAELGVYLTRIYLQYCIFVWNDHGAILNDALIEFYLKFIENESLLKYVVGFNRLVELNDAQTYRKMLKFFLIETSYYDMNVALSKLGLEKYPEERAIVLGKMGKHHEALDIYVNTLNDTDKAEAYCNYVYTLKNVTSAGQVYYELLQIYLKSEHEEIRIDSSIRLLNAHSKEIGTSQTLEMLPAQLMKCQNLSQFFETMLYRLIRNKHDTQVRNKLMIALQLQVHETKILCQDKKFVVTDEQICKECNKRMGKSAMVRFPDGVLIHYGCLKKYET